MSFFGGSTSFSQIPGTGKASNQEWNILQRLYQYALAPGQANPAAVGAAGSFFNANTNPAFAALGVGAPGATANNANAGNGLASLESAKGAAQTNAYTNSLNADEANRQGALYQNLLPGLGNYISGKVNSTVVQKQPGLGGILAQLGGLAGQAFGAANGVPVGGGGGGGGDNPFSLTGAGPSGQGNLAGGDFGSALDPGYNGVNFASQGIGGVGFGGGDQGYLNGGGPTGYGGGQAQV